MWLYNFRTDQSCWEVLDPDWVAVITYSVLAAGTEQSNLCHCPGPRWRHHTGPVCLPPWPCWKNWRHFEARMHCFRYKCLKPWYTSHWDFSHTCCPGMPPGCGSFNRIGCQSRQSLIITFLEYYYNSLFSMKSYYFPQTIKPFEWLTHV